MDGLGRAVGDGVAGMVASAFDTIGSTLRFMVASANAAVPGGLLPVLAFSGLLALAWYLARK